MFQGFKKANPYGGARKLRVTPPPVCSDIVSRILLCILKNQSKIFLRLFGRSYDPIESYLSYSNSKKSYKMGNFPMGILRLHRLFNFLLL